MDKSPFEQTLDAYEAVIAGGKERERLLNKIVAHQEDVIKLLREKCELLQKRFDAKACPETWMNPHLNTLQVCSKHKGHDGIHDFVTQ